MASSLPVFPCLSRIINPREESTETEGVPTPPLADESTIERIKAELLEGLSLEEHLIVEQLLAGESIEILADRLGISRRTLYRRLADIRQRIGGWSHEN